MNLNTPNDSHTVFSHVPNKSINYSDGSDGSSGINSGSDDNSSGSSNKNELLYALKNSFGFGGMNASLVLAKFKE